MRSVENSTGKLVTQGANPGGEPHRAVSTVGKNGSSAAPGSAPDALLRGKSPVYGALDLGTNNCRLLLATPKGAGFQVIDAFSRIIRLGEGLSTTGRLSQAAMDRTIEALQVCTDKMIRRDVKRTSMVVTQACRAAENGKEFIARVFDETGLRLKIIDPETEARLAVVSCAALLDHNYDGALVFDIGGGSTELSWIELGRAANGSRRGRRRPAHHITGWISLPVGVVNITEKFGGVEVTKASFEAMVDYTAKLLEPFEQSHNVGPQARQGRVHLLGTSGTVTTLAGIHLELPRYNRAQVDGQWLEAAQIDAVTTRLLGMDFDARARSPCVGRERADLVLAGCAILEAIRRLWPCPRLRVADRGLREGLLSEMMHADGFMRPKRAGSRRRGRRRGAGRAGRGGSK